MIWLLLALSLNIAVLSEEEGIRRIHAHLLIEDAPSALVEAENLNKAYPDSSKSKKLMSKL